MRKLWLVLALLLIPSRADAKKRIVVEEDDEEEEYVPTKITVGIDPLELIGPMFVGGFELRGPGHTSGALYGGYGTPGLVSVDKKKFWEVAGQFRYYVGGSFDGGIHVGAEVMYLGGPNSVDATSAGANLSVGGFVGFKYVLRAGFTLDSQIGVRGVALHQKLDPGVEKTGNDMQLLTRFLIGWTF